MSKLDQEAARDFSARVAQARKHLRREMDALGLTEAAGWRIAEKMRMVTGGCELVLRPLHLRLDAPEDLECVVFIGSEGGVTDLDCREPS